MTNKEYFDLLMQARKQFPRITLDALKEIKKAYSGAVESVIVKLKEAEGYSPITVESLKSLLAQLKKGVSTIENQLILNNMINNQLRISIPNWLEVQKALSKASRSIGENINLMVPDVVKKGAGIVQGINEDYLIDVINLTGGAVSETGIVNMFFAVNDKLIANIAGRIFQDGYSYSQRIWGLGNMFDDDIKRILMTGLVEGRDILDIAKDLDVYVNKGYQKLMGRYGSLIRGTAAFRNRIRQNIYYPSMRLVRSELYAGLHDNAIYCGKINPACNEFIDWIKNTTEDWNCQCPEFEAGSPYPIDKVPGYPHSNCLCDLRPRLMDRKQFVADMTAWGNGENVPYIENWYNQYYRQFAEVAV